MAAPGKEEEEEDEEEEEEEEKKGAEVSIHWALPK